MNNYILSPALQRAVEVALLLDRPLLLCGEPGTGKTTLAKHLATQYSQQSPGNYAPFHPAPLVFNTKTTSLATDLFYTYDALERLRDAYSKVDKNTGDYIKLRALGTAIAFKHGNNSKGLDAIRSIIDFKTGGSIPPNPVSSLVLIDEIDKAPRDFPNDILNEIEKLCFEIRELNATVPTAENNAKVLMIMTSNNEKNLPDAFLRRCVYYYISFPDIDQMDKIIKEHFPALKNNNGTQVMGIIKTFNELRKLPLLKKPATAEFIDWLHVLDSKKMLNTAAQPYDQMPSEIKTELQQTIGILLKNNNDIEIAKENLANM
jgi:MoxR-like ATPase